MSTDLYQACSTVNQEAIEITYSILSLNPQIKILVYLIYITLLRAMHVYRLSSVLEKQTFTTL